MVQLPHHNRLQLHTIAVKYNRIQLNIAKAKPDFDIDLNEIPSCIELIVQAKSTKGKDLKLWDSIRELTEDCEVTVLIDPSGGRGLQGKTDVLRWPHKVGYAGGINAGNIQEKIMELESDPRVGDYWLDMESGVRTNDWFDTDKVLDVLYEYSKAKDEIEGELVETKCIVCNRIFRTKQDEKICPECHIKIEFEKEMQRMTSRSRMDIFIK